MAKISPREASLLALLAEEPASRSRITHRIMNELQGEAREIAEALRQGNHHTSPKAAATARGLHDWVKTNKLSSSKARALRRRSKTSR